jgi:transposase-like protein
MNTAISTMDHVVAYNAACPACQSSDVRPSQRAGRYEFLHRWRNEQRYRCRTCRHSFYVALTSEERAKLRESENVRKKPARGSRFVQSRTQHRVIEAILFLGMLLVFYLAFNSLVSKDGSGLFSRPSADAQP